MNKRKKMMLLCFAVLLCMIICIKMKKETVVKTVALPVSNKTIILDAGHGLPDNGTVGFNGTAEQKINLEIVLKLQSLLEQSGCTVILTRADENGIYEACNRSIRTKKLSDMKKRVYIGNNSEADIYLSIHLNYYIESKYRGWQTFFQSENNKSKRLAEIIQQEITNNLDKNNRKPKTIRDSYILKKITIPSVIVECGFLSNPSEEQNLKDKEYQSKLAWGIYIGIQKYFEEDK